MEIEVLQTISEVGDTFVVKPGEKIPTDGIVVAGYSSVDEKIITVRASSVEKGVGSEVIGATINKTGLLRIRATRVGEDTPLMQIMKLVEEASASSAPIQRFADHVIGYFVLAVFTVAGIAFTFSMLKSGFTDAFLVLLAILLIACPAPSA